MIIAAAIQLPYQDPHRPHVQDLVIFVPRPGRHHNALHALHAQFAKDPDNAPERTKASFSGEVQGFLTDEGEFLDRRRALLHARYCGQILDESAVRGKELFSEDLW